MDQGGTSALLNSATVTPTSGNGSWTWNGTDANGTRQPDGPYKIVVQDASGTPVSFTTQGTVTGVQRTGNSVNLQLGGLSTDLGTVASLAGAGGNGSGGTATTN